MQNPAGKTEGGGAAEEGHPGAPWLPRGGVGSPDLTLKADQLGVLINTAGRVCF